MTTTTTTTTQAPTTTTTTSPGTTTTTTTPVGPDVGPSQIVTGTATIIPDDATAGTVFTATSSCTDNATLLSGGYTLSDSGRNLHYIAITEDSPSTSENGVWTVTAEVSNVDLRDTAGSLTAYAVCSE